MRTALEIYFGLNLFITGYKTADKWHWTGWKKEELFKLVVQIIAQLLLSSAALALFISHTLLKWMWKLIDQHGIVPFYLSFYFTDHYNNLDERVLRSINEGALQYKNSNSKHDRIWRKCTELINKRNNYIHEIKNER